MRRFIVIALFSLGCAGFFKSWSKSPQVYCKHALFLNPASKPYLETYLTFVGGNLGFKKLAENSYVSQVEVKITLFKEGQVYNKLFYNLTGPEISDTLKPLNFVDVQRMEVENGNYLLEYQIKDLINASAQIATAKDSVIVNFKKGTILISDIEFVESYSKTNQENRLSKSGYDLVPYVFNFYPASVSKLIFYSEIYGTSDFFNPTEQLVLRTSIASYETGDVLNNFSSFTKVSPKQVLVCFNEFSIKELPSGNYNLVIELVDKRNSVLASQKVFFQRLNPKILSKSEDLTTNSLEKTFVDDMVNLDSLREFVRCLRPIANQLEENFISKEVNKANIETLQRFFLDFWRKRNPQNPEEAWLSYKEKVDYVNEVYKTPIKKGYATDRGRVYLKYGEPNQMSRFENEPSSYPYEIWQYYQTSQRNNRRFVFYNPDLVTNDYILIHSDAIGETRDDRWRIRLIRRNNAINNFDDEKNRDHFGSKVDDMYSNPR